MTNTLSYKLTIAAQTDLIEIRHYTLFQWGSTQSKKYLSELHQTITLLSESPLIGKQRPEVGEGVFSFPHKSHVIYYILSSQQLIIFAVIHKNMIPTNHLENRDLL